MELNNEGEQPKNIRGTVSILGFVSLLIAMVFSVQADGSMIPDIWGFLSLVVILVAEKVSLREGPNS